MAWFTITTLLGLIAFALSQDFTCPPSEKPGECLDAEYPYALDCTRFWACGEGCISHLMSCPASLHFSDSQRICVSQAEAMCQVSTTVGSTLTTPASTQSTTVTQATTVIQTTGTTQPATTTTQGSQPPLDPTIFYVTRLTNRLIRQDPVDFQAIICDRHNDFNSEDNSFTTPDDGIYFFNLNVGLRPSTGVNYRIELPGIFGQQFASVLRESEVHPGEDLASRDLIVRLQADDQFHVTSTAGGFYSDDQQQTSWGGFSIQNAMDTISAFSVGRQTNLDTVGVVSFSVGGVNTNGDFVNASSMYIAPEVGLYFVAVSAGVMAGTEVEVDVLVNGAVAAQLVRRHSVHDNTDTLSRSVLLQLNQGDGVQYYLRSGSLYSDSLVQTSFSGFLVNPRYLAPCGWFVSKTTSWDGGPLQGALSPVDFDAVLINEGGLYNTSSHVVRITSPGFYYVHFGAGAMSEQPVDVTLVLNDVDHLANVIRVNGYQTGVDTLSRGFIRAFDYGDVLKIEAAARTSIEGDDVGRLTYFLGIQLYSTE